MDWGVRLNRNTPKEYSRSWERKGDQDDQGFTVVHKLYFFLTCRRLLVSLIRVPGQIAEYWLPEEFTNAFGDSQKKLIVQCKIRRRIFFWIPELLTFLLHCQTRKIRFHQNRFEIDLEDKFTWLAFLFFFFFFVSPSAPPLPPPPPRFWGKKSIHAYTHRKFPIKKTQHKNKHFFFFLLCVSHTDDTDPWYTDTLGWSICFFSSKRRNQKTYRSAETVYSAFLWIKHRCSRWAAGALPFLIAENCST